MTQAKRRALGRGLETLLPRKQSAVSGQQAAQEQQPAVSGQQTATETAAQQPDGAEKQTQGPSTSAPQHVQNRAVPGTPTSPSLRSGYARDDKELMARADHARRANTTENATSVGHSAAAATTSAIGGPVSVAGGELRELALEEIEPNPFQTRRRVKEEAIEELAASIRANGVMQPIVVRPAKSGKFQLIAGERRWLASKKAGKARIPALVRQVGDQQALEMTIIENIQREDLGPLEQARAFERLSREFGMTQEMMAQRTGKDRATVANYLRLLKLPGEVQIELESNFKITLSHAKLLLMLDTEDEIRQVAKEIVAKSLSVAQTEEYIFNLRTPMQKMERPARVVDPNVRQAERELEQALGCRVRIKDRKGRGKIVIEYANLTDFDRVVEKLS